MSKRKNTCTSDDCSNQPEVTISFLDGQTGHYCQVCAAIIQRNPACGVKSVQQASGADLVVQRVMSQPTPKRVIENW